MRINPARVYGWLTYCGMAILLITMLCGFYGNRPGHAISGWPSRLAIFAGFWLGILLAAFGLLQENRAKSAQSQRIAQKGVSTMARILKTENKSYYGSGGIREALLTLEMHPSSGPTFRAEATVFVGVGDANLAFPPGTWVQAYYDPDNPSQAALQ